MEAWACWTPGESWGRLLGRGGPGPPKYAWDVLPWVAQGSSPSPVMAGDGASERRPVLAKRVGLPEPAGSSRPVVRHRGQAAETKRLQNEQRAQSSGLYQGRPERLPLEWAGQPSLGELSRVEELDGAVERRISTARMQSKDRRTGTALGVVEGLRSVAPDLIFFKPLANAADLQTSAHNERALCRIAEHARATRGIRAGSISGYVSAIKLLVERQHGQPVLAPQGAGRMLKELYLSMRREDGPSATRRLGRAMRAYHIRQVVAQPGFAARVLTPDGCMEHAIRHAALQCFLRPGEVGTPDGQPFTPATQLVCGPASVQWVSAAEARADRPKLFLMVLSIKDSEALRVRVPICIEPRAPGGGVADPFCPYLAILAWWTLRTACIPREHWDHVPLFVTPGRSPADASPDAVFAAKDMLPIVRRDAAAAGVPIAEVFGNAYRIGGATDLRDAPSTPGGPPIGMEQATRMIKKRGRWYTDIQDIYERMSLAEHALASAAITEAGGVDLEQVLRGWVQPGR